MTSTAITAVEKRLMEAGLSSAESFIGCTEEEVINIESRFAIRLPQCYRDFLAAMGRDAGKFLVGTDYSYPKMLEFRKEAEGLVRACQSSFSLPTTSYVFMFHQGYTFLFFDCQGSVDPSVFMFTEAEREPRKTSESFSEWLLAAAEDDIAAYRELEDLRGS